MDALFGGSFDPVHLAHLVVADTAAEALGARVRLMPAREQPFKQAAHGAQPEQRVAMLALAVAGNPRLAVEDIQAVGVVALGQSRALIQIAQKNEGEPRA